MYILTIIDRLEGFTSESEILDDLEVLAVNVRKLFNPDEIYIEEHKIIETLYSDDGEFLEHVTEVTMIAEY